MADLEMMFHVISHSISDIELLVEVLKQECGAKIVVVTLSVYGNKKVIKQCGLIQYRARHLN